MEIILNGDKEVLDGELNVVQLLEKFEMNPNIVTVSLNGDILDRDAFESTIIKGGDSVDILMFMGGGM